MHPSYGLPCCFTCKPILLTHALCSCMLLLWSDLSMLQSTMMSPAVEQLCAVRPDEIEIMKRNGEDWLLGAGGFGAVSARLTSEPVHIGLEPCCNGSC